MVKGYVYGFRRPIRAASIAAGWGGEGGSGQGLFRRPIRAASIAASRREHQGGDQAHAGFAARFGRPLLQLGEVTPRISPAGGFRRPIRAASIAAPASNSA